MPAGPAVVVLVFAVTDTGVIDPDRVAAATTQQVIDRLACVLPQQIPQGYIYGADGARLAAAIAKEVYRVEHILPVALNIKGAAPDQEIGKDIMHHRADGARHIEGFTQADQAVIGVDAYPGSIRLLI